MSEQYNGHALVYQTVWHPILKAREEDSVSYKISVWLCFIMFWGAIAIVATGCALLLKAFFLGE